MQNITSVTFVGLTVFFISFASCQGRGLYTIAFKGLAISFSASAKFKASRLYPFAVEKFKGFSNYYATSLNFKARCPCNIAFKYLTALFLLFFIFKSGEYCALSI